MGLAIPELNKKTNWCYFVSLKLAHSQVAPLDSLLRMQSFFQIKCSIPTFSQIFNLTLSGSLSQKWDFQRIFEFIKTFGISRKFFLLWISTWQVRLVRLVRLSGPRLWGSYLETGSIFFCSNSRKSKLVAGTFFSSRKSCKLNFLWVMIYGPFEIKQNIFHHFLPFDHWTFLTSWFELKRSRARKPELNFGLALNKGSLPALKIQAKILRWPAFKEA